MQTPEIEYRGIWWLPNDDSNKVAGVLSFGEHRGRAILSLIGGFNNMQNLLATQIIPLILGFSSDGKQITLCECGISGTKLSFPGFPTEKYDVQKAFIGVHFNTKDDIKFRSVAVLYSNASEWVGLSGITFSLPSEDQKFSLQYSPKKVLEVNIDENCKIEILHRATGQPPKHCIDMTEAGIKEKVYFQIITLEDQAFDWFLKKIALLSNFLTLGIGSPVFPLSIDGTTDQAITMMGAKKHYEQVSIFFIMAEHTQLLRHQTWDKMFFALGHIAKDFEMMIKKWFEKSDLLEPVYDLYCGTLYNSAMYVQHEFLSLIQALETYHRRIYGGEYVDGESFQPIYQSMEGAIPSGVESDFKDSLKAKLKYGNEFSLRKRLKQITDKHAILIGYLINNSSEFITQIVDTRNYLTHYSTELESRAKKGYELYVLSQKIKFLIEICFLTELGLAEENIKKRLIEDQRYNYIKV